MPCRSSRRVLISLAREVLGSWEVSGITAAEAGLPQFITYTGTTLLGLGGGLPTVPTRWHPSRTPRRWAHGSAQFVCRSGCSLEWRTESRLRQRRKRFGRRTGALQLESVVVQGHSPSRARRCRSSNCASSPSTLSTTLNSKTWILTRMTETSAQSPATTVPVCWSWAESSFSRFVTTASPGAAGFILPRPFFA